MVGKRTRKTRPTRGASVSLPLTRETLAAAYDYLKTTPPFSHWNLPDSEDIKFKVTKHTDRYGHHCQLNAKHEVAISTRYVGRTQSLMESMAHEMIHIHQEESRSATSSEHNAAFHKYAAVVCKYHGFDPKTF